MDHIDYGLGAFRRSLFATIPAGEKRDFATVYQDLRRPGRWQPMRFTNASMKSGHLRGCVKHPSSLAPRNEAVGIELDLL